MVSLTERLFATAMTEIWNYLPCVFFRLGMTYFYAVMCVYISGKLLFPEGKAGCDGIILNRCFLCGPYPTG